MNTKPVVGFVGLGNMGGPMSANVAKAGFELLVNDVDVARAEAHAAAIGARAAKSIAEFSAADVIVLMLPTSKIVRAALFDENDQSRIDFKPGAVIVDMSSSEPNDTREIGALLSAAGAAMVDAPVSGGIKGAADGTLAIMLGGDDDGAIEKAVPVIDSMSRVIRRTGALGSGHATKALNNYLAATAFAAASEALAIGEKFGLDQATLLEIIEASTGQSWNSTHVLGPQIVERKFASGFALPLITKDVVIAQQLAETLDMKAPLLETVSARFNEALDGLGNVDHTLAYQQWFGD